LLQYELCAALTATIGITTTLTTNTTITEVITNAKKSVFVYVKIELRNFLWKAPKRYICKVNGEFIE